MVELAQDGALPAGRPAVEPALAKMIDEMGVGAQFALPGSLCAPVFTGAEADGLAMRVLMSMLWMSADTLKRGEDARFQAALADIRHASGFTRYKGNAPVRRALLALEGEACLFADGDGMSVFSELEIVRSKDLDLVQWRFEPEFAHLFVQPARFAVLDIREIAALTKSIDVFFYRQAMLVRKMRRPEFRLPASELYRVCEIAVDTPFKRVVEKVRRTLVRVTSVAAIDVAVKPIQERGSRSLAGLGFRVSSGTSNAEAA